MGVISDGSYGIPKGLIFSYPVTCQAGGKYSIVQVSKTKFIIVQVLFIFYFIGD